MNGNEQANAYNIELHLLKYFAYNSSNFLNQNFAMKLLEPTSIIFSLIL